MAKSRESTSFHGKQEFAGVRIDNYTVGSHIVINNGKGDWVDARVTAPATLNRKGELVVDVTFTDSSGTVVTETKTLTEAHHAPDIIKYTAGAYIDERQEKIRYEIKSVEIGNDGTIFYTVESTDRSSGTPTSETHRGISQDYVDLLSETNGLRVEAARLKSQIKTVLQSEQQGLQERYLDISKKVQEAFAALPEIHELQSSAQKQLHAVKERVTQLHNEAEVALNELAILVGSTKNQEYFDPKKVVHVSTEAERNAGEDTPKHSTTALDTNTQKREIASEQLDRIKKSIAASTKQYEKRVTKSQRDVIENDYRNKVGKGPREKLNAEDKKILREQLFEQYVQPRLDSDIDGLLANISATPAGALVLKEIDSRRKKSAKREIDSTKLQPGGKDYEAGEAQILNRELLLSVLEDWKRLPDEDTTTDTEEENTFDFDAEFSHAVDAYQQMLASLQPEADAASTKTYQHDLTVAIGDELRDAQEKKEQLSSRAAARAAGVYGKTKTYTTIGQVRTARVELINEMYKKLAQHREAYIESERKSHLKEQNSQVDEREATVAVIDIPQAVMAELLQSRKNELKDVIEALATKDPVEARAALVGLFDASSAPHASILDELAQYGITNWEAFIDLWQDQLVDNVLPVMREQLQATFKMQVSQELGGSAKGLWKQIKKNKWGIAARAAITTSLVAGAALAAPAAVGAVGLVGILGKVAAGVGAGAAVGAARGAIAKVGNMSWLQRAKKAVGIKTGEELQTELRNEEEASLLQGTLSAVDTGVRAGEGVERYAAIMSHVLRATTSETLVVGDVSLSGDARVQYEQALAKMEVRDQAEAQKVELARLISALNRNGDEFEQNMRAKTDPAVISAIEKFARARSGHDGVMASTLVGAAVGGALTLQPEFRALVGGAAGAALGYKTAESWGNSAERESAGQTIRTTLESLSTAIHDKRVGAKSDFTPADKEQHLLLKKLLHGTAAPELLVGLGFVLNTKAADGTDVSQFLVDAELRTTIQSAVFEAERSGIMVESADQVADMQKMLTLLQKRGEAVATDSLGPTGFKKFLGTKKDWYKGLGAVAGFALGAGASLAGGALFSRDVYGATTPEDAVPSAATGGGAAAAPDAQAAMTAAREATMRGVDTAAGVASAAGQGNLTAEHLMAQAEQMSGDIGATPTIDTAVNPIEVAPAIPTTSVEFTRVSEIFEGAPPLEITRDGISTFDEIFDTYLDNLSPEDQTALVETLVDDLGIVPTYDANGLIPNAQDILDDWSWDDAMGQIAVRAADIPERILSNTDFRDGVTALGFDPDNLPDDALIPINGYDNDSRMYNIMLQPGNTASIHVAADGTPYVELGAGSRSSVDVRSGFRIAETSIARANPTVEPIGPLPAPDPEHPASIDAAERAANHDPRDFNDNERTTMRERRLARSGAALADFRADVDHDAVTAADTNNNDRLSLRERRMANDTDVAASHPADVNNDGRISGPERRYFNANPEAYGPQTGIVDQMARTIITDVNATHAGQVVEGGDMQVADSIAAARGEAVSTMQHEVQTVTEPVSPEAPTESVDTAVTPETTRVISGVDGTNSTITYGPDGSVESMNFDTSLVSDTDARSLLANSTQLNGLGPIERDQVQADLSEIVAMEKVETALRQAGESASREYVAIQERIEQSMEEVARRVDNSVQTGDVFAREVAERHGFEISPADSAIGSEAELSRLTGSEYLDARGQTPQESAAMRSLIDAIGSDPAADRLQEQLNAAVGRNANGGEIEPILQAIINLFGDGS